MSNKIFYDPYNEIRCDRFALETLIKESEAKDQRIIELEEQLHDLPKKIIDEIEKNTQLQSFDYGERYCEEEASNDWAIDLEDLKEILDTILKSMEEKMSEEQKYNELREQKDKEIQELKQQLAEKTLTIEQINKAFIENRSLWKGKYEQSNQDKISFAIEQLEQLKKLCQEKFNWWENSEWEGDIYDKSDVSNAYFDIEANIEEQINELKGNVKDE